MSRIALLALLLFLPAFAQTQLELTATYGPPDLERYQVAPGIDLTVTYGRDHLACRLELSPRAKTSSVSSHLVDRVLNQFVPVSARRGEPRSMLRQNGCAALRSDEYDNVSIHLGSNECAAKPDEKSTTLVVEWKRAECARPAPAEPAPAK